VVKWSKWFRENGNSGADPTTCNYNASVVNFYNATSTRARFENKNIFIFLL
jgi:hypothetical protein